MNFDTIRPILSGLIGGIIALWMAKKCAHLLPDYVGGKSQRRLMREHRTTLRIANTLSFLGLLSGPLFFYWSGWLSRNDWRGLGLAFGLMAALPIAYIALVNASRGIQSIKECLIAYAISQKTPVKWFYGLIILMAIAGLISAISLFS